MNCPRCGREIAEHEADRTTDACVARVVFGWQEVYVMHGVGAGVPPGKRGNTLHDDDFQMCRPYSTDANAMMEVWMHMLSQGLIVDVDSIGRKGRIGATFAPPRADDWPPHQEADTLQLAVCRAALAAAAGGGAMGAREPMKERKNAT